MNGYCRIIAKIVTGLLLLALGMSALNCRAADLKARLQEIADDFDGRLGIALLCGEDIISVRGDDAFPMLSVYKFPQALAVAHYCQARGIAFEDSIDIRADQILPDTYSPMRERYGITALRLPIMELLAYTLQQSDNNACDILFELIGGPAYADSVISLLGFDKIKIISTEAEMHDDLELCRINSASPLQTVLLLEYFYNSLKDNSAEHSSIARLMEQCETGVNRLAMPLLERGLVFGHNTGTGDRSEDGLLIGCNDVGYVVGPDGRPCFIAVYATDSPLPLEEVEKVLANISRTVLDDGNFFLPLPSNFQH